MVGARGSLIKLILVTIASVVKVATTTNANAATIANGIASFINHRIHGRKKSVDLMHVAIKNRKLCGNAVVYRIKNVFFFHIRLAIALWLEEHLNSQPKVPSQNGVSQNGLSQNGYGVWD